MASDEIKIVVTDGVSPSISPKLKAIADNSIKAESALARLQAQMLKNEILSQRLAGEKLKVSAATARLTQATQRAEVGQQAVAAATARASAAATRSQQATVRLAASQEQLTAAQHRTAMAALRLQKAQDGANNQIGVGDRILRGWIATAATAAAGGLTVGILGMADAYTTLQNKLATVTTSQAQVAVLTERLFSLANETRTGVDATAQAFSRFDRALNVMGKSQNDSLRMTETVNKALVLSGATAGEASSALLQLSQAFNSGRLQGDEFRSIAENMPVALDAIAKVLGKPVNQLKRLSSEGKITAAVLYDAFRLIETQVDESFGKTNATIGQALTVAKNNAIKFFGELDKSLGVTRNLSQAIIFLSENLDKIAVAAGVAGVAMLFYFGPTLIGAVATATRYVLAFNVAILANPWAALAVGVVAAIGYIAAFGDEVKTAENGMVTFKDEALTVWGFIVDGAADASEAVANWWGWSIDQSNEKTKTWGERVSDVVSWIVTDVTAAVIRVEATWSALVTASEGSWNAIGEIALGVLKEITNAVLWASEIMLSSTLFGEVKFGRLDTEKGAYGSLKDEIETKVQNDMADIKAAFAAAAFDKHLERLGVKNWVEPGQKNWVEVDPDDPLRPAGKDRSGGAQSKKSGKEMSRAAWLAKINAELDNETRRLVILKPLREAVAKFDEIAEQAIGRRIKLTALESSFIKEKIQTLEQAKEIQGEYDRIYEEINGPARKFEATSAAINLNFVQGEITLKQYNREFAKAAETYRVAVDPFKAYNDELAEQIRLLALKPQDRGVEAEAAAIKRRFGLNQAETEQLKESLRVQQLQNESTARRDALLGNSVEKRREFVKQLEEINRLQSNPYTGADFKTSDATMAKVNASDVGQYIGNGLTEKVKAAELERQSELNSQLDALRNEGILSEQEAADAKAEIWREYNRNVADASAARLESELHQTKTFFTNLSGFQKIKQRELFEVGRAAAIANATVSTYQAAVSAYAAMASIPVVGPALGAAAAAGAIAAGLANVSEIASQSPGFAKGGYTGDLPRNEVAGQVHGREFVLDADSTARIGRENLERLQRGTANVQSNTDRSVQQLEARKAEKPAAATPTELKLRLINAIDKELFADFANTSEGEKVIMNLLRRNRDEVVQILEV